MERQERKTKESKETSPKLIQGNKMKMKGQEKINQEENGITLIALIITMVLHYDKVKKCSNSNSFLLSSI